MLYGLLMLLLLYALQDHAVYSAKVALIAVVMQVGMLLMVEISEMGLERQLTIYDAVVC